jgi:hypothetical protein
MFPADQTNTGQLTPRLIKDLGFFDPVQAQTRSEDASTRPQMRAQGHVVQQVHGGRNLTC